MELRPPSFRPTVPVGILRLLLIVVVAVSSATSVSAEIFFVLHIEDSIPPTPGSLRAAIEQSEANGVPDVIDFLIDGGTIELVAPLPNLDEGRLTLGFRLHLTQPTPSNGIAISGINGIPHALRVRSAGNTIAGFDFIEFSGPEVILIDGDQAAGNLITGCVFGRDNAGSANTGAAIRIKADPLSGGTPAGTVIRVSRFVRNGTGVLIEGDLPTTANRLGALIVGNWFGTDPFGAAGPGNSAAIQAADGGQLIVTGNRFSGPGDGILLEQGSDGSTIASNHLGLRNSDLSACSGFAGAAIRVEGSVGVDIVDNVVLCNQSGISLGQGTALTTVRENRIGGPTPAGQITHGIVLDGAGTTLIAQNSISGSGGFGITETNTVAVEPTGTVLTCNSVWNNTAGALNLPSVVTQPPVLLSTTPIRVNGTLPDDLPGWIEMFGDDLDQARVFQGASAAPSDTPTFSHLIPVLGLMLGKEAAGTELSFDRTTPANHTSTLTPVLPVATTELSNAIASSPGVAYDIVRGGLENLAFGMSGGIDLGPVLCLGSSVDPDVVISPDVVDPDDPDPGFGFFYVVRRDDPLGNANGTYDPALCLANAVGFNGPRRPASGDCD